jgi:hypothetical protein
MITVTILDRSSGRPLSGRRVTVHWSWSWSEGYTDRNGSVNLDGGPGQGHIYVSGQRVREGSLSGHVTVYTS